MHITGAKADAGSQRQLEARSLLEAHSTCQENEARGGNFLVLPATEVTITGVAGSVVNLYEADRSVVGGHLLMR